MMTLSKSDSKS